MAKILKMKEQLKGLYEKYNIYIDGIGRFLFSMFVFMAVILNTGYQSGFSTPFIAIILALICSFCPSAIITPLACALLIAQFTAVSMEPVMVLCGFLFIMLLTYFIFRMGNSWIMALTLLLCCCNLSGLLLPLGLFIAPLDVIVVVFGIIVYGIVLLVKKDTSVLSSTTGNLGSVGKINYLLNGLLSNPKFLLVLISITVSLILITYIRRSRFNYAIGISTILGGIAYLCIFLLGNSLMNAGFDYGFAVFGFLAGEIVSTFVILFIISVNYRRTEYVQFEDDEYYYYVKAVPKNTVAVTNVEVVNITSEEGNIPKKEVVEKIDNREEKR